MLHHWREIRAHQQKLVSQSRTHLHPLLPAETVRARNLIYFGRRVDEVSELQGLHPRTAESAHVAHYTGVRQDDPVVAGCTT